MTLGKNGFTFCECAYILSRGEIYIKLSQNIEQIDIGTLDKNFLVIHFFFVNMPIIQVEAKSTLKLDNLINPSFLLA